MKKLLFSLLFVFTNTFAQEFTLKFNGENSIEYNSKDWEIVAQSNQYELFVDGISVATKDHIPGVHSLVEFYAPDGVMMEPLRTKVKKIYSYGIMECKNGIFHLLNSWYVDKHNQIIFSEGHDFGTYQVEVLTKNTPRNDLYLKVCGH